MARTEACPAASRVMTAGASGGGGPSVTGSDWACTQAIGSHDTEIDTPAQASQWRALRAIPSLTFTNCSCRSPWLAFRPQQGHASAGDSQ
jgi:hypothetical protein